MLLPSPTTLAASDDARNWSSSHETSPHAVTGFHRRPDPPDRSSGHSHSRDTAGVSTHLPAKRPEQGLPSHLGLAVTSPFRALGGKPSWRDDMADSECPHDWPRQQSRYLCPVRLQGSDGRGRPGLSDIVRRLMPLEHPSVVKVMKGTALQPAPLATEVDLGGETKLTRHQRRVANDLGDPHRHLVGTKGSARRGALPPAGIFDIAALDAGEAGR